MSILARGGSDRKQDQRAERADWRRNRGLGEGEGGGEIKIPSDKTKNL